MTENEVAIKLRSTLLAHLAAQGISAVDVLANYQPTSQGRVEGPAVYFFRVSPYRYGAQHRSRVWNQAENRFDYIERQWLETTFQMMAVAPQDPANLTLPTPGDILQTTAMIMNSRQFIDDLRPGIGMQRISAMRNPYFVNDRGQFEATPSFDFVVSHLQELNQIAPVVDDFEFRQGRV